MKKNNNNKSANILLRDRYIWLKSSVCAIPYVRCSLFALYSITMQDFAKMHRCKRCKTNWFSSKTKASSKTSMAMQEQIYNTP